MRWTQKDFRPSNSTDVSSRIDDFVRLDARVGSLSRKRLRRETLFFLLCKKPDLVSDPAV